VPVCNDHLEEKPATFAVACCSGEFEMCHVCHVCLMISFHRSARLFFPLHSRASLVVACVLFFFLSNMCSACYYFIGDMYGWAAVVMVIAAKYQKLHRQTFSVTTGYHSTIIQDSAWHVVKKMAAHAIASPQVK
jgi:hypothetical protein